MSTVGQWMKHPVHTVKPLDSVAHVRAVLERHRINQVPVVVNGRVVGIVTDRDLRDAAPSLAASGGPGHADAPSIPVESVMSAVVLTVAPDEPLRLAAGVMRRERIGAMPVVQDGRLVGIVTRSDVLAAFAETESAAAPL